MANCPRCGTADFYPSFSGKGECVNLRCDLYVAPKMPELTPDLSGPHPEASELPPPADQSLTPLPWVIRSTTAADKYFDHSRGVDATEEKGVQYTPEDSDNYDLTLREITVAVGVLATHMSGYIVPVAMCKSIAKQFTDNVGIPLHTYLYAMPQAMPKELSVWFLGRQRTLRAERQPGRGCITLTIR